VVALACLTRTSASSATVSSWAIGVLAAGERSSVAQKPPEVCNGWSRFARYLVKTNAAEDTIVLIRGWRGMMLTAILQPAGHSEA